MRMLLASAVLLGGIGAPVAPSVAAQRDVPVQTVEVVERWPHDPAAFTQGLLVDDGDILESSGQYGSSTLRRVDLRTGTVRRQLDLGEEYFAEGIALLRGTLYQLTWREGRCLLYDPTSFTPRGVLAYDGEAWGLTHDTQHLILSDGTHQLRFLDPATLGVERTISVLDRGRPVPGLNELEYVNGQIFANVLNERRIARIDPHDGALLGWLDLTDLVTTVDVSDEDAVLNGIAYDDATDRLFVTGKRWPTLFEIRIGE
jgi:glutamine cyclotransferase